MAISLALVSSLTAVGCGKDNASNASVTPPETEAGTGTVVISGRLVE